MPDSTINMLDMDNTVKILVVDDEPPVRTLISRWLSADGYTCFQASNVEEALSFLENNQVDLATLDISMPGDSGIALLETITKSNPHTSVIMITAASDTESAIKALTGGAWGYLVKPIQREELLFQVRSSLQRRQLIIENSEYRQKLEKCVPSQDSEIQIAYEEIVYKLLAVALHREGETAAHMKRIGLGAEVVAKAMGWPPEKAELIRMAAPLHDLGNIKLPQALLKKPEKLTREEFEIVKTHTILGGKILHGSDTPLLQMAREIALWHHEHWDGGGYPTGASDTHIPESARIVAIVDVYDALTHNRCYRPALPGEVTANIMQQSRGRHFDTFMLGIFMSCLNKIDQINFDNPDENLDEDTSVSAEDIENALFALHG